MNRKREEQLYGSSGSGFTAPMLATLVHPKELSCHHSRSLSTPLTSTTTLDRAAYRRACSATDSFSLVPQSAWRGHQTPQLHGTQYFLVPQGLD